MRIYSDKILAWNEVLRAAYAARVHPGKWLNTYTYKIQRTQPVMIYTAAPIELLTKDRKYYLYDNLLRNKACDHLPNYIDIIEGVNFKPDTYVYLPFTVAPSDFILIHEDVEPHEIALA